MRVMRCVATLVTTGVLLATGCTSDHGALPPPPTPLPTDPGIPTEPGAPADGVAPQALLTLGDLPAGFTAAEIDPAERWGEAIDTTNALTPLRPGCADELTQITATLSTVPDDAAGVGFSHDDGREIVQFAGVATPEAGLALIAEIAQVNSRCDAYTLQVAERGSLALSVQPIDLRQVAEGDDRAATGWQTTILSDHLRWTQQYVALTVDGVVVFLAMTGGDITGELPIPEADLDDLVRAAVDRAGEAG